MRDGRGVGQCMRRGRGAVGVVLVGRKVLLILCRGVGGGGGPSVGGADWLLRVCGLMSCWAVGGLALCVGVGDVGVLPKNNRLRSLAWSSRCL